MVRRNIGFLLLRRRMSVLLQNAGRWGYECQGSAL